MKLDKNQVFIFSLPNWREKIKLENVPYKFEELKKYLQNQQSKIGNNCLMEGIVWHHPNGDMVKIKRKDFTL